MNRDAPVADVVVIGAGIVGAAVARAAALRGLDVVLVDPAPGQGASSGNAGLVVPGYSMPLATPRNLLEGLGSMLARNPHLGLGAPLSFATALWLVRFALASRPGRAMKTARILHRSARRSADLYRSALGVDPDVDLRRTGWLWTAESELELRGARATAAMLTRIGVDCRVLGRADALAVEPGLGAAVAGGVWLPEEWTLDPESATAALLSDAEAAGARVLRVPAVGALMNGRRVVAVQTSGETIGARSAVLAAGAESGMLARWFGSRLPVIPGYGWSLTLSSPEPLTRTALMSLQHHVVVSSSRQQVRLTSGMRIGGRRPGPPNDGTVAGLREVGERLVPELRGLREIARWSGARPMTPDGIPRLGLLPGTENVLAATGHGALGVTLAPAAGETVAERVAGLLADHRR